eukprot:gene23320-biopygen31890
MTIPAKKRMCIFLDWICSGSAYQVLARLYNVNKSIVSLIIHDAISVLSGAFVSDNLQFPVGQAFIECMDGFENLCSLPMCAGAIDGTFIRIESPAEFGDAFYCYKKYHAILLFACVDSCGLFTYLRVGEAGSAGDAACFNRSDLGFKIGEYLAMPQGSQPRMIDCIEVLPYLVGDGAFKLTEHLMKCFEATRIHCALYNYLERRHPYPTDLQMVPVVPSDMNTANWEPGTMGASGHKRNL